MSTVQQSSRAFFSFPEVLDVERHRDYNAWHQLDHRPENLALPGVLHGDRWVRTPECRRASDIDVDPTLSAAQYVAMYWFAEPWRSSVEQWTELGETTREEGRRPELAFTERRLTGLFRPLHGLVDPAARVSLAALPHRPARGVLLEVQRVAQPGGVAAEAASARLLTQHLPAVVALDGVAGSWTFASRRIAWRPVAGAQPGPDTAGALRITVHWCDGDPVAVAERVAALPSPDAPGLTTVLRTPLRTIDPWEWDWFAG